MKRNPAITNDSELIEVTIQETWNGPGAKKKVQYCLSLKGLVYEVYEDQVEDFDLTAIKDYPRASNSSNFRSIISFNLLQELLG